MADPSKADWRPPTDNDWRRLRTLLRDVMIHLQAEQDLAEFGSDKWAIGIGRYADRAEMCRVLACWVEDEYRALEGGHRRQVPGTLAP